MNFLINFGLEIQNRWQLIDDESTVEATYRGLAIRMGERVDRLGRAVLDGDAYPVKIVQPGDAMDLSFTLFGTPIIARSASEVFRSTCPTDVDLIPAKVEGFDEEMFALNILAKSDCLDKSRTEYRGTHSSGKARIVKPEFDPSKIVPHGIQRVAGHLVSTLISESMRTALAEAGMAGWTYRRLTETGEILKEVLF